MRRNPQGGAEALTGAGAGRAIEPRKSPSPWGRRRGTRRKATPYASLARDVDGHARSKTPSMYGNTSLENREIPWYRLRLMSRRPRRESLRTYAGDERAWEVGQFRSTEEVSEQGWPRGGGGGDGGKGTGHGDHAPAKPVSDTAPKRPPQ